MNESPSLTLLIQLNLSTMATLGTEKSGHCREGETKVNAWTFGKKNGCCREVAISGGVTVQYWFTLLSNHLPVSQVYEYP